jgi:hypothetical protein
MDHQQESKTMFDKQGKLSEEQIEVIAKALERMPKEEATHKMALLFVGGPNMIDNEFRHSLSLEAGQAYSKHLKEMSDLGAAYVATRRLDEPESAVKGAAYVAANVVSCIENALSWTDRRQVWLEVAFLHVPPGTLSVKAKVDA